MMRCSREPTISDQAHHESHAHAPVMQRPAASCGVLQTSCCKATILPLSADPHGILHFRKSGFRAVTQRGVTFRIWERHSIISECRLPRRTNCRQKVIKHCAACCASLWVNDLHDRKMSIFDTNDVATWRSPLPPMQPGSRYPLA
jgi:hypothetical protein